MFIVSLSFVILFTLCSSPSDPESVEGNSLQIKLAGKTDPANNSASFTIINGTSDDYIYQGYGKDLPSRHVEMLADTGWAMVEPNWCGTGLELQKISPGQKISFEVKCAQKYDKWRVIIYFSKGDEEKYIKVISDVVDF